MSQTNVITLTLGICLLQFRTARGGEEAWSDVIYVVEEDLDSPGGVVSEENFSILFESWPYLDEPKRLCVLGCHCCVCGELE